MAQRMFKAGSWIALAAGAVVAMLAVTAAVTGVLALTGKVTYPVEKDLGPFTFTAGIAIPVSSGGEVCQRFNIRKRTPESCYATFLQSVDDRGDSNVRRQNSDVRMTMVSLTGYADVATKGGWNSLVATIVARTVIELAIVSAILLLVWRLLAAASSGEAFTTRTVRYLRGIGWLVVAGALIAPALGDFMRPGSHGYSMGSDAWPGLTPMGGDGYPGGLDLTQLALGGLILLAAEVFRRGAALEAERRLTV